MREDDLDEAAAWLRRVPANTGMDQSVARLLEAYPGGDSLPGATFMSVAREVPPLPVASFAAMMATSRGEIEAGMALLDSVEARGASPAWMPPFRALMLAGTGRPDSAGVLQRGIGDPQTALLVETLLATAPFLPIEPARAAALRNELRSRPAGPAGEPLSTKYAVALLFLRAGEVEPALALADSITAAADTLPALQASSARLWARSIRATAALGDEDPEAALAALGEVDGPISLEQAAQPLTDRTRERYLLGTLLVAAGRPDEAVPWLEHGIRGALPALVYLPMSHLRLGEAHELAGRDSAATQAYARFLRYFAHAEPAMQGYVREARTALGRLTGEGRGGSE